MFFILSRIQAMSRTKDAPNLTEHRAQLARDPLPQSQSLDNYNRGAVLP